MIVKQVPPGIVFSGPRSAMPGDIAMYDRIPRKIICQYCNTEGFTTVIMVNGNATHAIAIGLCVVGCCPCALLPYCVDSKLPTTRLTT